jgi:uncharacterized protein (DUF362 family)
VERRQFLRKISQISLGLALSKIFPGAVKTSYGEITAKDFDVGIVTGDTKGAVIKAVDLIGGMKKIVKAGDAVAIKPNMGFPNPPAMASTTNPEVVRATVELCIEAGAKKVLILDHPLRRPEVCLKRNGIEKAVKGIGKAHVFLVTDRQFFQKVKVPKGKVLHQVEILKDVLDSDVLINIPVAKSHGATGVTLGLKGLMGVIFDREYFHEKVDLNQAIADLSTVIKPNLTLIDATRVMTYGGPTGPGAVEQLNTIVAGTDPVAVDSVAVPLAKWYGHSFEAKNVKHIKLAHEMGLGEIRLNRLKIMRTNLHGEDS